MEQKGETPFRTARGYEIADDKKGAVTSSMEDYLEMIYRICLKKGYARVGMLSSMLNVKPSSASKMIFKLSGTGYIKYDRYGIIMLTDKGGAYGKYLLQRHNIIENFLSFLGSGDAFKETELIEHSLSERTVKNLDALLGFIKECGLTEKWQKKQDV
ncbi:MAG TPA: DtxR family transcriptional regulator [Ruminococcaceae bacterium]|nr:DtxR family transcriptional regulator [Oscillospiraceae bacterium]